MPLPPLPTIMLEPLVRAALLEDLGRAGDITTEALIPPDIVTETALVTRAPGIVAGLDLAILAFRLIEPAIAITIFRPDGARVEAGATIAVLKGPAQAVLTAERTALNFLCRLSGIATATAAMVESIAGTQARIVCTRKTTPGLRAIEKYAVRAGGGANHRFGLDDAMLIKDNHVAIAGGIGPALSRARERAGHLVRIELEVDSLAQLEEALAVGVDAVLLDNFSIDLLRRGVGMVGGRAITEASGGITPETAREIAATGVDLLSVGWLTHSAAILDIGLDYVESIRRPG
jgi:nicotinate-nucleotide pyrophosphorylase (carboxylating)